MKSNPTSKGKTQSGNAAIYARFSSHAQREESIEQQIDECRLFAAQNGFNVVEVYSDHAVSGRKETRAAYQRMIHDAEKNKFTAIIAYKSSRIARNMLHSLQLEDKLEQFGVSLFYAKEEFGNNAAGRFALRSMMNVNQFYSENMAEDIMRGMEDNAKSGKRNGGVIPFGYRKGADGRFEVDPERADIVREIYSKVRDGEHPQDIANQLNERGIKTSLGNRWVINSLNRILHNERYLGTYIWNGVRVDGAMPQILSAGLFRDVQDKLSLRQKQGAHTKSVDYILSGRLFCGECGGKMVGVSGTSKLGRVYSYYDCNTRRAGKCDKKPARKDWIEERVLTIIKEHVLCDKTINWIADEIEKYLSNTPEQQRLKTLADDLASLDDAIKNILAAIEQGNAPKALLDRLRQDEGERARVSAEISTLSGHKVRFTRDQVVSYLESFRSGDASEAALRRHLIKQFIGAVYLYDDKIKIGFSFSANKDLTEFRLAMDECSCEDTDRPPSNRTPVLQRRGSFFTRGLFINM